MNWIVVFFLSLSGLAVGLAEVFGLNGIPQLVVWTVVYLGFAIVIARKLDNSYFVHALVASMVAGLWAGALHALFIGTYIAHNPALQTGYAALPAGSHPRLMMVMMGPFYGAMRGIVAGIFAAVAGKIMQRRPTLPSTSGDSQQKMGG